MVFLSTHGMRSCDGDKNDPLDSAAGANYWSAWFMGQSNPAIQAPHFDSCTVYTTNAKFGDVATGDLNYAIFATCHSAQRCVFKNGWYWNVGDDNFGAMMGFHGISYDSWWNTDRYGDYVASARYNNLGDDWVDDLTDLSDVFDHAYWPYDQCATVVTFGKNKSDCRDQYNDAGHLDYHDVDGRQRVQSRFHYWCGCNPDNGEKLPDC